MVMHICPSNKGHVLLCLNMGLVLTYSKKISPGVNFCQLHQSSKPVKICLLKNGLINVFTHVKELLWNFLFPQFAKVYKNNSEKTGHNTKKGQLYPKFGPSKIPTTYGSVKHATWKWCPRLWIQVTDHTGRKNLAALKVRPSTPVVRFMRALRGAGFLLWRQVSS